MDDKIKKIIAKIISIKPDFGSITLELTFHQSNLTKVIICDKTEIVLLKNEEAKKIKGEKWWKTFLKKWRV